MANPKKIIGGLKAAGKRLLAEPAPAYSPKMLESTTAKFADKIAEANPKLTDEEVFKKATAQATKKLEWERVQKPALEKKYGALGKASFADSNPNKMQNTAEVVAERKRKANEFLDQPTEPWTPPRKELQAFDRSSIKDALEGFPDVEQSSFPRDVPTRASTSHVDELYADPENRALIEKQIKRGLPLGGETFYGSLYPIKQAVQEAGMPAEKFDKWIHSLAPASARNSIMNEMAVGQFLRNMNARGIPLTEENVAREMAAYKEKFGIGLPLMPIHRQGVANVLEGGINLREQNLANIPTNYKIPTYGTQKAGDFAKSAVLDVHEAGGHTQGSRFHPYFNEQGGFGNTEYGAGEQGLLGIAQDLGIPGGMAQAGRWFGGGELTGLKSPRGDALDLLEKQVAYTLKQKGIQPNPANVRAEVLKQIETGEGDLLPWYRKEGMPDVRETGLQRAEGGEVNADQELKAMIADHLDSQSHDQELRSMVEGYMAGGEVGVAGGGKMVKGATKAFKRLFNDNVLPAAERDANLQKFLEPSKAPMRLYHGTTASEGGKGQEAIRRIKPSKEGALGSGVYLTPSSAHASGYSGIPNDEAIAAMLSSQHHADTGLKALNQRNSGNILPSQEGGNMLPVHAQIRNPLIIEGTHGDPMIEALMKLGMDENSASRMVERAYENKGYIGKEVENRARAAGYDGLMQYRGGDLSEVVSYNPSAVKSAIGNRGTYDIYDPDLNKADGGKVVKGAVKGFKRLFAEPTTESKVIQPPSIIIPSKVSNVKEAVRQSKGEYGARRVERAADEIPNLEKLYKEQALREAFLGDNAKAVMTMNPADFQKYAKILQERSNLDIPSRYADLAKKGEIDKSTVPTDDYIKHLQRVQGGFEDMPYLLINKEEQGLPLMPFISGHEGRHRSRAMAESGEPSSLVQLSPRSELREPFPRRSQEEYIEALKRELEMTDNMVLPEGFERPPLKLPDIYADGGVAMAKGGKMVKGLKRLFSDPAESSMASTGKRKFEDGAGGLNIVKETGGNWLTGGAGSVERALKPLKRDEFIDVPQLQDPATTALNKWVDSNLTNYVKKQMATKDDPVRKLAEEGVVHMPPNDLVYNMHHSQKQRDKLGQPQLAQSDAAKAWENNTDILIDVAPAGEYTKPLTPTQARQGFKSLVETNPWLEKVAPETPINSISGDAGKNLGFDHIMDVLREDLTAGRIRPEQLNKVSMEQAVRRTYEYDQEMAKRMRDAQIKVTEGMPVHKEYADKGYKWIELAAPDGNKFEESIRHLESNPKEWQRAVEEFRENRQKNLETALKYEGDTMGHCVGSYCDDVASGKSRIYSLRDAKGEPHVTIEVEPQNEKGYYNSLNPDKRAELMSQATEYRRQTVPDWDANKSPDERAEMLREYLDSQGIKIPSRIKQIKGKQNAAPKEEYVPFVQDFVRSGEWSSVGDLSNTGLIPANAIKAAGHDMTGYDQKYFTNQEYVDFLSKKHEDFLSKNFKPSAEGMAEGGGAFKTLRFDNGGIASPDENLTYESKPSRFSKVASEMYDETKQSLANDYERLKNSGRARAQLAKIAALQMAGGAPDLAHLGINFVVDPLKDAIFTKPRPRSVLEEPPKAGEKRERVPMFGSIGEALTTKDGLPMGGSEHLIKRAQEAGLMYGKNIPIYDSEGNLAIDPETNEPYESRSGRFSLPTEIGGAILGGGALSKMRKVAGKGYQKFAEPRVDPAGALSRAIKADSNAMFNQNLRAR